MIFFIYFNSTNNYTKILLEYSTRYYIKSPDIQRSPLSKILFPLSTSSSIHVYTKSKMINFVIPPCLSLLGYSNTSTWYCSAIFFTLSADSFVFTAVCWILFVSNNVRYIKIPLSTPLSSITWLYEHIYLTSSPIFLIYCFSKFRLA